MEIIINSQRSLGLERGVELGEVLECMCSLLLAQKNYFETSYEQNGTRIVRSGLKTDIDNLALFQYGIAKINEEKMETTGFFELYAGEELVFAARGKNQRYSATFIQAGPWYEKLKAARVNRQAYQLQEKEHQLQD